MGDLASSPSTCLCCPHYAVGIYPHQCMHCGDMRCRHTAARWGRKGAETLEEFVGFVDTAQQELSRTWRADRFDVPSQRQRNVVIRALSDLDSYWDLGGLANA